METPDALTPLLRAYIRWAPWRLGKRTLWTWAGEALARQRRSFVARTRYGFRIAGDQSLIMPRCIYWFGEWEPPLSDWIRRALRPGDVFVDVGANFGWFTLLAARAVAPGGSVVAVEASPDTARRLEEALALNHVDNVRVVQAAAAAHEGTLPIYRAVWNDAEDSTVPAAGKQPAGEVRAGPLPALLTDDELRRARVIKIDVEGAELDVLRGLQPALGALRRDAEIAVETHPDKLAAQGASESDLAELLVAAGFGLRELPVDFSELAHLFPGRCEPRPLRASGGRMRHIIASAGATSPGSTSRRGSRSAYR